LLVFTVPLMDACGRGESVAGWCHGACALKG
jgi:hypothetical protein